MNPSRRPSVALLVIGTAVALVAALTGPPTVAAAPVFAPAPAPPVKISQNASERFYGGAGVACRFNGKLVENHWYRRFDLERHYGVSNGFALSQVVVAVENAYSLDGLPGRVGVSAIDHGDPLLLANLEPLASIPVDYASVAEETLLRLPVTAVVPAGKDLVVEAAVQPGTDIEDFRVGANSAPEMADDYLRADVCGYTEPTPFASIGWPLQNHILYAVGKATDCLDAEAAVIATGSALGAATSTLANAREAVAQAVAGVRKARRALKKAVARHGVDSRQVVAARAKVAKAKRKKAAKAKALEAATTAQAAATAAVPASEQSAANECAQPRLLTLE